MGCISCRICSYFRSTKGNIHGRDNSSHYSTRGKCRAGYVHCQVLNMTLGFRRPRLGAVMNMFEKQFTFHHRYHHLLSRAEERE